MIWYRRKLSNTSDLNLYIAYESIRKSHMNRSFKSLLIIMAALMLSGCGDVAEDGFTQAQLDAFIEEDYEDTSDTSSPDISAVEGDTAAGADTAGRRSAGTNA